MDRKEALTACTGVILAGGRNSRLPGIRKSFHEVGGARIIDVILALHRSLFQEVILVTNDPADFSDLDALIATDIDPSRCSLAGIHAGLFYARTPWIFVTASDTPFLSRELVLAVLERLEPGVDAVVPETGDGLFDHLCAAYSRECLPRIEANLARDRYFVRDSYRRNRCRILPLSRVRHIDPDGRSFFNINTPEDLEKAREMAGSRDLHGKE